MDKDSFSKEKALKPIQIGSNVHVYNGHGKLVRKYKTVDLGMDCFTMPHDDFYHVHGFHFVPTGIWYDLAKKEAEK